MNEKLTAFLDECKIKEQPKDALSLVQCQPCDNSFPDLIHYSCAKGTCQCCPKMRPHPVLMRSNTKILFHAHTKLSQPVLNMESCSLNGTDVANTVKEREKGNWLESFTRSNS